MYSGDAWIESRLEHAVVLIDSSYSSGDVVDNVLEYSIGD